VSKASSRRKSAAGGAASSNNVIQLHMPRSAAPNAAQPLLFTAEDMGDTPPWLIEEIPAVTAKGRQPKPRTAKKITAKRTTTPIGKQAKAKAAKAKAAPSKKPQIKSAKAPKRAATVAGQGSAAVPVLCQTDAAKPIERAMAPVVWRKHGPLDAVRFWLRSATSALKTALVVRTNHGGAAQGSDNRRRTRNELLVELAILRQENAAMRKQLGLAEVPFGRQLADRL
jgi:hypothetical protein